MTLPPTHSPSIRVRPRRPSTSPFTVTVNGDRVFEPNEIVDVVLSAPTEGTIADATGVGTITNDDRQPTRLTIHRRLAPISMIGRGLLEPATVGMRVRVAFFHRVG